MLYSFTYNAFTFRMFIMHLQIVDVFINCICKLTNNNIVVIAILLAIIDVSLLNCITFVHITIVCSETCNLLFYDLIVYI